jgi:surface polysaccharide O-acyltransferase-like enzyme
MSNDTEVSEQVNRPQRLGWLDANRVLAAIGVVLIHSTTDTAGQPFSSEPPEERVLPAVLRLFSELSGSEIFILFSMFLLAWKLNKAPHSYRHVVFEQAHRLFVPFVAWSVFYAFFRLLKASVFGYEEAILAQLSTVQAWVGYMLLGGAQYHLHFIPTLFGIVLMYPLFQSAVRYPMFGATVIGALYLLSSGEGWMWGNVKDPLTRDYLVRALKTVCYSGYAMAAFALFGAWKRGLSREDARMFLCGTMLALMLGFVATIPYGMELALRGKWVVRPGAAYYGHFLMPVLVFAAFLGAQYASWSPRFSSLSKFTFGVYLVHPIAIDVHDIFMRHLDIALKPTWLILSKWCFAVPVAFGISYLLAKTELLSWLIGLQKVQRSGRAKSIAPVPAE